MRNIKLIIEYDGTNYCGWQIQPKGETIQGVIESKLSVITKADVNIIGSGRTDAGVHALGQVANFKTESKMTPEEFKKALNSLLPRDIVIKNAEEVGGNFHSRFDAISRTYEYAILNSKTPLAFLRKYTYMLSKPIDVALMNEACKFLIGVHNFTSFASTGDPVNSYVRNVMDAKCKLLDKMSDADWWLPSIIKEQNIILFRIKANAFLKGMVRTIAGTLLEVGIGKMPPERVKEIIEMKNRSCAGRSLPPCGLCLVNVSYENNGGVINMPSAKIERLYQQHVKNLPTTEQLQLVELIIHDISIQTIPKKRSIMELHGLGKEIWAGIDAQEYVNELRKEWERKDANI